MGDGRGEAVGVAVGDGRGETVGVGDGLGEALGDGVGDGRGVGEGRGGAGYEASAGTAGSGIASSPVSGSSRGFSRGFAAPALLGSAITSRSTRRWFALSLTPQLTAWPSRSFAMASSSGSAWMSAVTGWRGGADSKTTSMPVLRPISSRTSERGTPLARTVTRPAEADTSSRGGAGAASTARADTRASSRTGWRVYTRAASGIPPASP